jgi:hypothetical protein
MLPPPHALHVERALPCSHIPVHNLQRPLACPCLHAIRRVTSTTRVKNLLKVCLVLKQFIKACSFPAVNKIPLLGRKGRTTDHVFYDVVKALAAQATTGTPTAKRACTRAGPPSVPPTR